MILILQIALAIVLAYLIIVFFPVILAISASLIGLALVVLFLSILIYGAYYLFTNPNTNLDFLWVGFEYIFIVIIIVAITLGIIFICYALFTSVRNFFKHARKREYVLAAIWLLVILIFIALSGN